MSGIEALRESLRKDIDRFDSESQKHKRLHRRCQTAVIVLTAITTMVAGTGLLLASATLRPRRISRGWAPSETRVPQRPRPR